MTPIFKSIEKGLFTMIKEINVCLIDNRPMVIQGIKTTLLTGKINQLTIKVSVAYSYQESLEIVKSMDKIGLKFDIFIVDCDMNYDQRQTVKFCQKYVSKLKRANPKSKIAVISRKKDNFRIYQLLKKIQPNAFIIESELTYNELKKIIVSILNCETYYSKLISTIYKKNNAFLSVFDDLDREILYYLSKGIKTKNLTKYIYRSLSSIEKRKQRIKDILEMKKGSDAQLLLEAEMREII